MSAAGAHAVVVKAGIPVMEGFMGVHRREEIRDPDPLRTFAFFDAVATGCAGDQVEVVEDLTDLLHRRHLRPRKTARHRAALLFYRHEKEI